MGYKLRKGIQYLSTNDSQHGGSLSMLSRFRLQKKALFPWFRSRMWKIPFHFSYLLFTNIPFPVYKKGYILFPFTKNAISRSNLWISEYMIIYWYAMILGGKFVSAAARDFRDQNLVQKQPQILPNFENQKIYSRKFQVFRKWPAAKNSPTSSTYFGYNLKRNI